MINFDKAYILIIHRLKLLHRIFHFLIYTHNLDIEIALWKKVSNF